MAAGDGLKERLDEVFKDVGEQITSLDKRCEELEEKRCKLKQEAEELREEAKELRENADRTARENSKLEEEAMRHRASIYAIVKEKGSLVNEVEDLKAVARARLRDHDALVERERKLRVKTHVMSGIMFVTRGKAINIVNQLGTLGKWMENDEQEDLVWADIAPSSRDQQREQHEAYASAQQRQKEQEVDVSAQEDQEVLLPPEAEEALARLEDQEALAQPDEDQEAFAPPDEDQEAPEQPDGEDDDDDDKDYEDGKDSVPKEGDESGDTTDSSVDEDLPDPSVEDAPDSLALQEGEKYLLRSPVRKAGERGARASSTGPEREKEELTWRFPPWRLIITEALASAHEMRKVPADRLKEGDAKYTWVTVTAIKSWVTDHYAETLCHAKGPVQASINTCLLKHVNKLWVRTRLTKAWKNTHNGWRLKGDEDTRKRSAEDLSKKGDPKSRKTK